MEKVMIVGAGKGGTSILRLLLETDVLQVGAIVDCDALAPGLKIAKEKGIPYGEDWKLFIDSTYVIIIDVTGCPTTFREIRFGKSPHTLLIPGTVAFIIAKLLEEKESLIETLKQQTYRNERISNSTEAEELTNLKEIKTMLEAIIQSSDDAISVVDEKGRGILINRAYSRITGLTEEEVIGKPANADISKGESVHMKVLQTRRPIRGVKMLVGPNRKEVIVNVAPIIVDGHLKGSVGVIHDMSEIQALTKELNRAKQLLRTLEAKYEFEDIVGCSEELSLAIEQARLSAKTQVTVLLRGESGTGKELFAHAIHNASDRKFNKFIRVNCGAILESLLESELFGYEDGAFSGARKGGKRGLFEEANNGSIFLDEIGEMSLPIQVKLLRVLQEKELVRVGGTKSIPINVRVIAATNVNLEKAIAEGSFREDLYYRLNRMPIHIPPLRERKDDLAVLSNHLLNKLNQEYGRNIEAITDRTIAQLKQYHWPGNVRELENVLGRAIIFMKSNDSIIDIQHVSHLLQIIPNERRVTHPITPNDNRTLVEQLDEFERAVILESIKQHNGNKTAAAKQLGISIRSLYYKLEKYKIEHFNMQ